MSVRRHTLAEIRKLHAAISGLEGRITLFRARGEIREALCSAYLANAAAHAMTYGEAVAFNSPQLPDERNTSADPRKVYSAIGLLEYNCISNDGRDFLPQKDRGVLDGVRLAIAEHLMDTAAAGRERPTGSAGGV